MGNFDWGGRVEWYESGEEWFWPFEPFSKLKTTFCIYVGKTKMVKEQELQLKVKFLWGYNMNIVI